MKDRGRVGKKKKEKKKRLSYLVSNLSGSTKNVRMLIEVQTTTGKMMFRDSYRLFLEIRIETTTSVTVKLLPNARGSTRAAAAAAVSPRRRASACAARISGDGHGTSGAGSSGALYVCKFLRSSSWNCSENDTGSLA